jgi:hypothetical protein
MDIGQRAQQSATSGGAPSRAWLAVVWVRVVLGLLLSGTGGVAFGYAWTNESTSGWGIGGMTLLVGTLLVLSGIYARSHPPHVSATVIVTEEPHQTREPIVPLLGALLVYKYQLITHRQLREALEEQQRTRPRRRLGEILALKGLITVAELEQVLAEQASCATQLEEAGKAVADDRPTPAT